MPKRHPKPNPKTQLVNTIPNQFQDFTQLIQEGIKLHNSGELNQAKLIYEEILKRDDNHFDALRLLGTVHALQNNWNDAIQCFDKALQINQMNADVFINRGVALKKLKRLDDALQSYDRALQIKPNYAEAWNNRGNVLQEFRRLVEALESFNNALQIKPNYAEAWSNRGNALLGLKRLDEALQSYDQVLQINPNFVQALFNRGNALLALKRFDEALENYNQILRIKSDHAGVFNNRGNALRGLKRPDEALQSYDQALRINPNIVEALYNRGNTLKELKRLDEALENYDQALRIKSDYADVLLNRGNILLELKRLDEALQNYDQALRIKPDYAEVFNNIGNVLLELKRPDEAIKNYNQALRIKPDYSFLLGLIQHTRMSLCDWDEYESTLKILRVSILNKELVSTPFPILSLIDEPELHKQCSLVFSENKYPNLPRNYNIKNSAGKNKPRIGYFSADFYNHATLHLIIDIFRNHDHSKFDFYAFSFGPNKIDQWRIEVEKLFTEFIDVRNQSDEQVAQLSRDLGIDIAIDLKGFTTDSRTGIFSHRAAPIQINYLGYPGTMGAQYIDYIIADKVVIPPDSHHFYTEKVLYLPNCYQPNIKERVISKNNYSRKDFLLPEDGVIFCSFNNPYKITPNIFKIWMDILREVKNSVLWILLANKVGRKNLKQFAEKEGIDSNRLIFAENLPIEEHLKRVSLADIFLDTFPYNAHTTASDAVRMGIPIITIAGNSFASRVASSILTAVNMPSLITSNEQEYKDLAITLGKNKEALIKTKDQLKNSALNSKLFDSHQYTKDLEQIYYDLLKG